MTTIALGLPHLPPDTSTLKSSISLLCQAHCPALLDKEASLGPILPVFSMVVFFSSPGQKGLSPLWQSSLPPPEGTASQRAVSRQPHHGILGHFLEKVALFLAQTGFNMTVGHGRTPLSHCPGHWGCVAGGNTVTRRPGATPQPPLPPLYPASVGGRRSLGWWP